MIIDGKEVLYTIRNGKIVDPNMIIDGKEVLYAMRNGKIVDPNIPTDGLICYLDTRGKTNTDKHKGTLLDLSGNGNHGTLENFGFNEESGYENGGLKFDGVDDTLSIIGDSLLREKSFTYFIDFEIPKPATEQNSRINLGLGFYIHRANNQIYNYLTNNPGGTTIGDVNVTAGRHIFVCKMVKDFTDAEYFLGGNSVDIRNRLLPDGTPVVFKHSPGQISIRSDGMKKINKIMLYNRALTDEETQQLMEV